MVVELFRFLVIDDCLCIVCELVENFLVFLVNLINLYCIEGQKIVVFEVVDVFGDVFDIYVFLVGNVGNIIVYWKGYCEYVVDGFVSYMLWMFGF